MVIIYNGKITQTENILEKRFYSINKINDDCFVVTVDTRDGHKYNYEYVICRHIDDKIEIDCKYNGGLLLKCRAFIRNIDKPIMNIIKECDFPDYSLVKSCFEETCLHGCFAEEEVNIFIMDLLLKDKIFSDWR